MEIIKREIMTTTDKKIVLWPASGRGKANYGWLQANYSFSFANWYDPNKIHFGALRVLNDDIVAPGMGFGKHPHNDMEIVTIPLEGKLKHRDSTGSEGTIGVGDIQVMSAGTGVEHSEMNASSTDPVKVLQTWIFPRERGVAPRYQEVQIPIVAEPDRFHLIVSPDGRDGSAWIHQDAFYHLGKFTEDFSAEWKPQIEGNGLYIFVIEGVVEVDGNIVRKRDALSVENFKSLPVNIQRGSYVLLIEVPMQF